MKEIDKSRMAQLSRKTNETDVYVSLNLDGSGTYEIDTGIPFFDHMLEQLSRHSGFDLTVKARGDIQVDLHHTLEDVGIVLGKALYECTRDKTGIARYGSTMLPMDDSLCIAAVDFCGRANLVYNCGPLQGNVGDFDTENIKEFFKAFVSNSAITLHINLMYGENAHHNAECIFKAVARTFKEALRIDGSQGMPSTKGCL
ncbi:MAG: imidazoleglycerol-phosphate dehydratase HisB [Gracilibacteraceae bacterium]|jgi:imidazoleglycerol-phosphate dehydratase|nr:imidazoleglycerol-phosphate dehydratase HisB [Gracilibacteraceae bacterium]